MSNQRKWTQAEDTRLLRQVKAFPQNLTRCFLIVAEELDRTPKGVAGHWYQSLSKRPDSIAFLTVSEHNKLFNRKNGAGEPCTRSVFHRILSLLGWAR